MAKIYGLFGSMQGKVADVVMAVRNGEQIVRKYQPIVSNPKSDAQMASRAKLKLLSQLGAALQPVIAIPRMGMVSPRNGFTQANYQFTTYAGDNAVIDLADVQLTKSSVALSGFSADRTSGTGIAVIMNESIASNNDAVVYVVLRRTDANKVAVASSLLVREAGADGKFAATLPYQSGDIAVCAYGIRYNTTAARSAFGNLNVPSATGVAKLFASRTLTEGDATMTETRGLFMTTADTTGDTTGIVQATLDLQSVTGAQISGVLMNGNTVVNGQVLSFVAGETVNVAVSGTGINRCRIYRNGTSAENRIATLEVVGDDFAGSFVMPSGVNTIIVYAQGTEA